MPKNPYHPHQPPKLTIELIPASNWFNNVRKTHAGSTWDRLREACYVRAGHRCEICNGVGRRHPVECHEIWEYDDKFHIQKLLGLIALCPGCHEVKHIGLALKKGPVAFQRAYERLAKVNQWPDWLVEGYIERQFAIHDIRSQFKWTLDLSWLDDCERYIAESVAVGREARKKLADATLAAMRRTTSS